ncbi:MAG TPA: sulfurtransferase TusA family protein [Candidatus Acidoferrales bacterium]|nr:sulfurtransferase TusA family protein [Candidatus Acidoferrales bacterium]
MKSESAVPMIEQLDLRGVRCPLSWAKAKVRLEQLERGMLLQLRLDDPKGARDLPKAAEAEGYAVLELERESTEWRIVIQK